jgi:hypothetical protein
MKDRKDQDTLARQEEANREVIAALGQLARDVEAPPDFVARVLAQADQQPAPRPARLTWLGRLPWGVDVAVAAVLILAMVGAVPQYRTWFNAYVRGVPADSDDMTGPLRTRGGGGAAPSPPSRADVTHYKGLREILGSGGDAPALPLGTWEANAGGDRGLLQLASVTRQGELRGTLSGTEIVGFWNERAQKVTFVRLLKPVDPSTAQLFTGYLFRNPGGLRGVGTATYTLAGSFEALVGMGATASQAVYGWYAQQGVTE